MRADDMSMGDVQPGGVLQWLIAWIVYQMAWMWTCYWWVWRVHIAARNGIPRSALEDPPLDCMRVLQRPREHERDR